MKAHLFSVIDRGRLLSRGCRECVWRCRCRKKEGCVRCGVSTKEGLLDEINRRMKAKLIYFKLNEFGLQIAICKYNNDAILIEAPENSITSKN